MLVLSTLQIASPKLLHFQSYESWKFVNWMSVEESFRKDNHIITVLKNLNVTENY